MESLARLLDSPANADGRAHGKGGILSSESHAGGLYLRALRHWWWALLLVTATTVVAAAFFTARQPRVYRAAGTVTVAPAAEVVDASDVMRSLETLERRTVIATFASVAEALETRNEAAALLELDPREIRGYRVRASVVPSTNIIRVTVEGGDVEVVARLANAVTQVLGVRARDIYRIFALRSLEAARPPRNPIRPEPRRNLVIGAIVGVLAGMLLGVGLESMSHGRLARGGRRAASGDTQPPRRSTSQPDRPAET